MTEQQMFSYDFEEQGGKRPTIVLEQARNLPDSPIASKIGGTPYLPASVEYPHNSGGPMQFIAQFNFGELPSLPGFPSTGMLQLFVGTDDILGLEDADGSLVRYLPELGEPSVGAAPVWDRDAGGYDGPLDDPSVAIPLVGRLEVLPISKSDFHYEQLASPRPPADDGTGHKLGGYPFFTQYDPRGPGDRRILLAQIDTDEGLMWGDVGVANWFIDPDELARLDFSNVLYNWDCH